MDDEIKLSKAAKFRDELVTLLNAHSRENGSDTPDFILADYLLDCLNTWDTAICRRERWYDRTPPGGAGGAVGDEQRAKEADRPE